MRRMVKWYLVLAFVYHAPTVSAQPVPCEGRTGKQVVACVEAAHPEKLVAGVSLETRQTHMAFLRDRVIETARCAGLDVGLNLKRGGPSISFDFIAWKHDGITEGVDIGASYDKLDQPLKLMWHTYSKAQSYGHPTYKAYGPVSCVITPPPASPAPDPDALVALTQRVLDLENALEQFWSLFNQHTFALADLEKAIAAERTSRETADAAHDQQIAEVRSRPIPATCEARGPFGLPAKCKIY